VMAVDVLGLTPVRLPGAIYQADLRQWLSVAAGMARQIVWVVVLAVAWIAGAGLLAVIAGRVLASLVEIAILLSGLPARLHGRQAPPGPARALFQGLLRASLPIALTALAACVFHRIDQVILHRLVDATSVGRYAAAANLVELFNILPTAVMSSLFPLLVKYQHAPEAFRSYVLQACRYLLMCAFGGCLVVTVAGKELMALLFGSSFYAAGDLAAILVWSELATFVTVVMTNVVLALGLQRFLPIATVVGAALNLGLNLVLIPRSGAVGAAWATVISYSAVAMVLSLGPREARPLALLAGKAAAVPAVLAVLALWLARAIPGGPVIHLLLASGLYVAGLLATRTVHPRDLRTIAAMVLFRKPTQKNDDP
jgi:O-antigen/teichoic acid export membrane protein